MYLKDIILEHYFSGLILLQKNNIYAANTLFCACFENLKSSFGKIKKDKMDKFKTFVIGKISDNRQDVYKEIQKKKSEFNLR